MPHGYHYLLGPVAALVAVGVLILLSRWAFGSGHRPSVLLNEGGQPDYGLLTPVATVRGREDADMLRELLAEAGIRATVVPAACPPGDRLHTGFQLLVFPAVAARARDLLASSGR
ncbi:MAG: hypothetical protein ACR2J0_08760 [Mycobacteriales bacterium]